MKKEVKSGGAGEIRTLGTLLTYTVFPGLHLKPLGHRSRMISRTSTSRGKLFMNHHAQLGCITIPQSVSCRQPSCLSQVVKLK